MVFLVITAVLPDGDVETALFHFVFDVAAALLPDVAQHLAQHPLECIAPDRLALGPSRRGDGGEAVVADVEGGAEEVATLLRGIAVAALQAGYVVLRPEHTRHDNPVQGYSLHIQAVEIAAADVGEQVGSPGHEVRDAVGHAIVQVVEGIGSDIDKLLPAPFCLLAVAHRGETLGIRRHTADGMPADPFSGVSRQLLQLHTARSFLSTTVGVLEFSRGSTGVFLRWYWLHDAFLRTVHLAARHLGKGESHQTEHCNNASANAQEYAFL